MTATGDAPDALLTSLLDAAAASFPGDTAISSAAGALTYRQLLDHVDRLAGFFAARGVTAGDHVALLLPNSPQWPVAFFAALRLGAVVLPCNPAAAPDELRTQLGGTQVRAVVAVEEALPAARVAIADDATTVVVVTSTDDYRGGWSRLRRLRARRRGPPSPADGAVVRFADAVDYDAPARQADVDATSIAVLQPSGGTTGPPHLVPLTHRALVANAHQLRGWLVPTRPGREVVLGAVPLFHVYGLTACLLTATALGGRLVLLPRFDVDLLLRTIDRERPTLFPALPQMLRAVLDAPDARGHDLRSIRTCVVAMMPLADDVHERFERVTAGVVVPGYALTEAAGLTHCNPVVGDRYLRSVGPALPGTDARIVDPDQPGVDLAAGQVGELSVRPPYGDWVRTGDLAHVSDEGYFTVIGRRSDQIVTAAGALAPTEVEQVLLALPGIADACVVAGHGRGRRQPLVAYVVLQPGATLTVEDVVAHAAGRLAPHAVPDVVELRDRLPRSLLGNARRHDLAGA